MKIGVPKEIKTNENRVALVPAGAEALVAAGHKVQIEPEAAGGYSLAVRSLSGRLSTGVRFSPESIDMHGPDRIVADVEAHLRHRKSGGPGHLSPGLPQIPA